MDECIMQDFKMMSDWVILLKIISKMKFCVKRIQCSHICESWGGKYLISHADINLLCIEMQLHVTKNYRYVLFSD